MHKPMEIVGRIQDLEDFGLSFLSDRIKVLQEPKDESEGEENVPLSDQAALGFLDFLDTVSAAESELGLTSARGWLCAQWTFPDGRVLIIWFKNRRDLTPTAFSSDKDMLRHIRKGTGACNHESASKLLVEERFFSWRQKQLV